MLLAACLEMFCLAALATNPYRAAKAKTIFRLVRARIIFGAAMTSTLLGLILALN